MMAAATTATARRATGFVLTVALAVCSCGGGALGFVLPSAASTAAAAPARGKAGGTHDLTAMYCCQSPSPLFAHTLFRSWGGICDRGSPISCIIRLALETEYAVCGSTVLQQRQRARTHMRESDDTRSCVCEVGVGGLRG